MKGLFNMKKYVYIFLAIAISVFIPLTAHAQGNAGSGSGSGSGSGQGSGEQLKVQDPSTHDEDSVGGQGTGQGTEQAAGQGGQMQNQNQENTQNKGEDYQLRVTAENGTDSAYGVGRSGNARQHMSNVAQAVEDFLANGNKNGVIGGQVSDVAQAQRQAQSQIGQSLDDMDNRKGFMRSLLGPDYGALKDMKQLMQQNQVRIQQLENLKTQTQNQAEQTQLQLMIQAMVDQNAALQMQVQAEEDSDTSVFGWLSKLLNN